METKKSKSLGVQLGVMFVSTLIVCATVSAISLTIKFIQWLF